MQYTIFGILQGRALHDIEIPIWAYYISDTMYGLAQHGTVYLFRHTVVSVFRRGVLCTTEYK